MRHQGCCIAAFCVVRRTQRAKLRLVILTEKQMVAHHHTGQRPFRPSILERVAAMVALRSNRRRRFQQLLWELRSYSRSELQELGIDPVRVEQFAWEVACKEVVR